MNDALDIPAALDRRPKKPPIYTYTILNTFKNVCPHQAYRRYVKKDLKFVETPQIKFGNEVHAAFEQRIGSGKPLPKSMEEWEAFASPFDGRNAVTEQKLGITSEPRAIGYWDENVWLRGKVDISIVRDEAAYIVDLKTGNSAYEDAFELEVGALLLFLKYPKLKAIKGNYIWLKENRLGRQHDLSDVKATWNVIKDLATQFEENFKTGKWDKRQSGLCGWCNVEDCEHRKPR